MNFTTKTGPLMIASLLAATSVFGQDSTCNPRAPECAPPECRVPSPAPTPFTKQPGPAECQPYCPPCQPQVCRPGKCGVLQDPPVPENAAYNAPAEINIGLKGEIDFRIALAFLYWQPTLDHFSYAFVDQNQIPASPVPGIHGKYLEMEFDFKPGFQAGAGMNLPIDDWDIFAEYTRVHGTHRTSSGDADLSNGSQASILPTMGNAYLLNSSLNGGAYQYAHAKYINNLDFVDAEMGRTYYVGKRLVFRSAFGLRSAWILQKLHVRYEYPSYLRSVQDQTGTFGAFQSVLDFYDQIHSWGIGPRTGLTMDWLLGRNIRFIGSGYLDMLYTRYHLRDKTALLPTADLTDLPIGQSARVITRDTVSAVRTHLDLEIGLGWGYYFDQKNWHLDLSATYGFQVFFSQNMFRQYFTNTTPMISTYSGDMNIQGLTITAKLDF